jgi:hypothetical protein
MAEVSVDCHRRIVELLCHWMVTEEQYVVTENVDRRAHLRYRFVTGLEYKLIGSKGIVRTGRGRTVNVSNSGLLFESEAALSPGVKIELSITLPLLEAKDVALHLQITGWVVRMQDNCAAVRFERRIFEIQSTANYPSL